MRLCPACYRRYPIGEERCPFDGALLTVLRDPRVGQVLGGRYRLQRSLGKGGLATVYEARHDLTGRSYAVKVLHRELRADETLVERLRREGRAAAAISHPNVVEIYDFGMTSEGDPYLVMELLEGRSLRDLLIEGSLEIGRAIELAVQIAEGLARGHDLDIIHRDLKPENVLVVEDEEGGDLAKLVDFGLARALREESHLTGPGQVVGTPQYMAPERLKHGSSTAAADLYALGLLLFEMIAGRSPFLAETTVGQVVAHMEDAPPRLREVAPDCPEEIDQLVDELLSKDPQARPVDAYAVVRRLRGIRPESAPVRPPRRSQVPTDPGLGNTSSLARWKIRVEVFRAILRRTFEGAAPPELEALLSELSEGVEGLEAQAAEGRTIHAELEGLEAEIGDARDRLGHALHVLGLDLSKARVELRAAEERRQRALARAEDLEFQLAALRTELSRREAELDPRAAELRAAVAENGRAIKGVEEAASALAARLSEELRAHEALGDFFVDEQTAKVLETRRGGGKIEAG